MDSENRKAILELLETDRRGRVLHLSCGDSSATLQSGNKVVTTELFQIDMVDEPIQRCAAKGIEACYGDLNAPLPLDNESFEVVCANQVLEHLHHTDLFIGNISSTGVGRVRCHFNAKSGSMVWRGPLISRMATFCSKSKR